MPRVIGTLTGQARTHHVDAPFVIHHLWSIIGDTGGVVSFILPSALALLSFHMSTGKLGSRPSVVIIPADLEWTAAVILFARRAWIARVVRIRIVGVIRRVLLDDVIESAGFVVHVGEERCRFLLLNRGAARSGKARVCAECRGQPGVCIETVPVRVNLIELLL